MLASHTIATSWKYVVTMFLNPTKPYMSQNMRVEMNLDVNLRANTNFRVRLEIHGEGGHGVEGGVQGHGVEGEHGVEGRHELHSGLFRDDIVVKSDK